jgi:hypothetical protein
MSGNQYVTDLPRVGNPDVCPVGQSEYSQAELNELFLNGVIRNNVETNYDPQTNRFSTGTLMSHVDTLRGAGVLKKRPEQSVVQAGIGVEAATTGVEPNMDELVLQDANEYKMLHEEYCFYEQRYRYALRQFLTLATSRNSEDNAQARSLLSSTIRLNRRVNAMIEIMNFLAQERVDATNANKEAINTSTKAINERLAKLRNTFNKLSSDYKSITTTKEMIRYTTEKNNNVTNQISLWATLNVLSIATIFYVYRSS